LGTSGLANRFEENASTKKPRPQKKRAWARFGVRRFGRGYPREPRQLQAAKSSLFAVACLTISACSQPATNVASAANDTEAASEQQYQSAPELTGASFVRDGRVELSAGGRVVQAMGYLFVAPGAIARLRVGGGAEVLTAAPRGLAALALDYDNKGAATVSGMAQPGETVGLRADGVERGQATADKAGRFILSLSQPLTVGPHDFELVSPSGDVRFSAGASAAQPIAGAPYAARREGAAWRVDWITPGGGEQTTLILDGAARPA
jgi:hypothetical protein